jgi:hypothetical protein
LDFKSKNFTGNWHLNLGRGVFLAQPEKMDFSTEF